MFRYRYILLIIIVLVVLFFFLFTDDSFNFTSSTRYSICESITTSVTGSIKKERMLIDFFSLQKNLRKIIKRISFSIYLMDSDNPESINREKWRCFSANMASADRVTVTGETERLH